MSELKTLKDIQRFISENYICDEITNEVFISTEEDSIYKNIIIFPNELKAEAVKWVKRLKDKKFYDNKENLYWFIEHFFNLTEEDLKSD